MEKKGNKGLKEEFVRFFKDPSRESLKDVLKNHLGEQDDYDFKKDWPEYPKLARHLLALANYGGALATKK